MRRSSLTAPRRIVVDLVPMRADGVNGGIKPLTLDLLSALARRGWRIACACRADVAGHLREWLPGIDLHPLEPGASIEALYAALVARDGPPDLVFFPMQAVSFLAPGVPCVSAVMDLQFADLPDNFTAAERAERERSFHSCTSLSDRIVAISRFTAGRIAAISDFPAERIDTIPIAPTSGPTVAPEAGLRVLDRLGVRPDGYILYPANFWTHKNHLRLIEAFRAFVERTQSDMKLVLTGDPASPLGADIAAVARTSPGESVMMPGHLPADDFAAVLGSARALVFPSLYEGFGMPLVEAMQRGVPVAAAWNASLPEVSNRAALLFDPLDTGAVSRAIEAVLRDEDLRADLVERGLARAGALGTHDRMVDRYEACFASALSAPRRAAPLQVGLFLDGWMGRSLAVAPPADLGATTIEIGFEVPMFLPRDQALLAVAAGPSTVAFPVWRGTAGAIRQRLGAGSQFELSVEPAFGLSSVFATPDRREVSLRIRTAHLHGASTTIDLLQQAAIPARGSEARPVEVVLSNPKGARVDLRFGDSNGEAVRLELVAKDPTTPAAIQPRSTPGNTRLRISVVIPSFNQGRFIARTIESILRQERADEVLVFDGGSTDETLDVLRSFGRAIRFESGPDSGQAQAVNRGIAAASGDIIAWINSDDTYEPGAFAAIADAFARDSQVGVIYGEGSHIDEQDAVIERYPTENFDAARLLQTCFLCQPATFFRRQVVERHGALRESLRYCLDYELWLRLARGGVRFRRIDAFLANTRFYPETKTSGSRPQAHFEAADMLVRCHGVRSIPWMDHFAEIVVEDFVRPPPAERKFAFERIRSLARAFWDADTAGKEPARGRSDAMS